MLLLKYKTLACIILVLFLASCATILNKPVQKIYISTGKKIKVLATDKVVLFDTAAYAVSRSDQLSHLTLQIDSMQKIITPAPKNSLHFGLSATVIWELGC